MVKGVRKNKSKFIKVEFKPDNKDMKAYREIEKAAEEKGQNIPTFTKKAAVAKAQGIISKQQ